MTQTGRDRGAVPGRAPGIAGETRNSADMMLAPLRTIRRLHAMAAPAGPRSRPHELPISAAQQKIWVFSQLNPELPIFNTFRAYKIAGPLRLDLLARCLDEITARHEVLRTTYPEIDGSPRPVIADNADIQLEVSDSRGLFSSGAEDEIAAYCNNRISRPINLTSGPILRAEVATLAENEHILILVSHQMVFDGVSWSNLNRELTALYESYRSNATPRLNDIDLQYFDFALWQLEFLQTEALDELTSYWQQQLRGSMPVLGLPTQSSSSAVAYNEGHSLPFDIPGSLTEDLKKLGKREGVTLFVVLLSALNLLLRQFADQRELVVFTSVPCRTRPEFRNLIGLFSNFIPLRANLAGNPRFTELLVDVQKTYSGALGHQDLPFESILKVLQSGQESVNESLFQTLFVFENAAKKSLSFDQCQLTPLKLKTGFTKFDITLFMEEKREGLTGSLRYKAGKFSTAMVELMVSRFLAVLQEVVTQPEHRIEDIRCLSPAERSALARDGDGNGKVSAESKPTPNARTSAQPSHRMPETQMESLIASVWQDVLGIDKVGTHDNFFDLGGNSLLLVMLTGRLQKILGRDISIVEVFRDPTISSFAKRLGDHGSGGSSYDRIHERAAKKRRALKGRRNSRGRRR